MKAREKAMVSFDVEKASKKYVELYEDVIATKRRKMII
jgi:hypothetical protein